jgi:hypothetical protein
LVTFMSRDMPLALPQDQKIKELRRSGVAGTVINVHRSMATFRLPPGSLMNLLGIPLFLITLSMLVLPSITGLWKYFFLLAQHQLQIPGDVTSMVIEIIPYYYLDIPTYTFDAAWPGNITLITTGIIVCVLLLFSFLLPGRFLPLAYLLRAICFIQFTALVYFTFASGPFAYHLSAYTEGILRAGIIIILIIPLLFALTLYLFKMSLARKLLFSIMTIGHLMIFLPLQMLVHSYIIYKCSFLVMPVMFFLFGVLLQVFIIISFYCWAMGFIDVTKQ